LTYSSTIVTSALLYHFFFPQDGLVGKEGVWAILIVASPLFARLIFENLFVKKTVRHWICLICCFASGNITRFTYDVYSWVDPMNMSHLGRVLKFFSTDGTRITGVIIISICTISVVKSSRKNNVKLVASNVALAVLCYSSGIGVATNLRSITRELRYEKTFYAPIQENQITQWFMNKEFKETLVEFSRISSNDDIFTSNFPPFGSLTLVSITGKRVLFDPAFGELSKEIDPDYELRKKVTFEFSSNPTRDHVEYLNGFSVNWFIVDLEQTTLTTWEPWATTRFINSRIAILELNPKASD
jgi:hypothetical protein